MTLCPYMLSASQNKLYTYNKKMPFVKPDHFSNNIGRLTSVAKPYFAKYKEVSILDIAPEEGRSSLWFLSNFPNATITVISPKMNKNLEANLSNYKDRTTILYGTLSETLKKINKQFDFVYIDIGPDSRFTLEAAVLAFDLMRPKAMMVFDDYTTDHLHTHVCPKPAIDAFADNYSRYIKVVHASWQFMLIKRSRPLSVQACKSEYYHENIATI